MGNGSRAAHSIKVIRVNPTYYPTYYRVGQSRSNHPNRAQLDEGKRSDG